MIIIFGRRQYGRVDACGSEYAHTTFAHLYYVPLIPISSFWVTDEVGNTRSGFPIPIHGKSVLAAYLRVWAPIIALVTLFSAPITVGGPIALGLSALSAWAWTWRSIRGELAARRSDFNRLAFGMRAEPEILHHGLRVELQANLQKRWERLGTTQSPNDIGRFGAKDPGEAVTAYGLLRLSAIEHGGREEHEAAERILAGMHDKVVSEDGPYRHPGEAAQAPQTGVDVHQQIASAAATVEARRHGDAQVAALAAARAKAPISRAKKMIVGAAIGGAIAAGGLMENGAALRSPTTGTLAQVLAASSAGDYVTFFCDQSMVAGELAEGTRVSQRVFVCAQGDKLIAVTEGADVQDLAGNVTGKLVKPGYADHEWWNEVGGQAGMAPVYLDAGEPTSERIQAGLCIGLAGVSIGLLAFGLRARKRAKR